ncbi:unnamed protein product [Cyclocybe aegerita]|uniref:Uncharacterized protein n=1 Tax=Cyclocybe aegerita TaxID=1973307 RepID=A0A8S0WU10_CYCAE|nr:unnamed protein product [Cyclocybe aegerita]
MATPFSWSDTVQIALGSCLPCLRPTSGHDEHQQQYNPAINRIPRARPDELQGLLADPDTDTEAERMSLHSNPGRSRNKKKRRTKKTSNNPRRITLFGYDLFGRPAPPPIQLPNDSEDALYPRRTSGALTPTTIVTNHSTASTFDSDAAPLDADVIAALSSPASAAAAIEAAAQASAEAEAQRLKEKEERRQRRREKRELKKLAETFAREGIVGDGEQFEGFQGSGGQAPPKMTRPGSDSGSGSGSGFSGSARRFVAVPPPQPAPIPAPPMVLENDDDDAADLDGGLYTRSAPRGNSNGGSDSRSRTSASMSDRAHQLPDPRNVLAHLQSQSQTRLRSPSQSTFQPPPSLDTTRKKKKSKSSSKSRSSATTSQSPSIASPVSSAFPGMPHEIVSPSTIEQGQGFFDLDDELPVRRSPATPDFPSTRIGGAPAGGFPITGFGGVAGAKRSKDFGAFLATRGDNHNDDAIDGL